MDVKPKPSYIPDEQSHDPSKLKRHFSKQDWHSDDFGPKSPVIQKKNPAETFYLYRRTRRRRRSVLSPLVDSRLTAGISITRSYRAYQLLRFMLSEVVKGRRAGAPPPPPPPPSPPPPPPPSPLVSPATYPAWHTENACWKTTKPIVL